MRSKNRFLWWVLLLGIVGQGCRGQQQPTGEITGTVHYRDPATGRMTPLEEGEITFWVGDDPYTTTIDNGSYEIDGVALGSAKVVVIDTADPERTAEDEEDDGEGEAAPRPARVTIRLVPRRYTDIDATPLEIEVQEGSQTFDIQAR